MNDFSEEKLKEYKEAFMIFDEDKDGRLNQEQTNLALMCLGYELSNTELNEMFMEYGSNKNNLTQSKMDFSAFMEYLNHRSKEVDIEDELMECFKSVDKDNDGKVSVKELKYVMLTLGENFSEEEISEMIEQINPGGEGYFSYQDFIRILLAR